jgi:hypothetical protein
MYTIGHVFFIFFLIKTPPSSTTALILLKALLQTFAMVSLWREALTSMTFKIREASEFWGASLTSCTKTSMPEQDSSDEISFQGLSNFS